jgi:hypothetical protein
LCSGKEGTQQRYFISFIRIDNPTIGLFICKTKDNIEAKYSLESSNQPIGISEYTLSKLMPDNFKSTLLSIEEIERELNKDKDKNKGHC